MLSPSFLSRRDSSSSSAPSLGGIAARRAAPVPSIAVELTLDAIPDKLRVVVYDVRNDRDISLLAAPHLLTMSLCGDLLRRAQLAFIE